MSDQESIGNCYRAGQVLLDAGRDLEALTCFDSALRRYSDSQLYLGCALAQRNLGNLKGAYITLGEGLDRDPSNPQLRYALALLNLLMGNWADGWRDYEFRKLSGEWITTPRTNPFPEWDRSELLDDENLLIYGEQGLGDEIMFASMIERTPFYYSDVIGKNQTLIECAPALQKLFYRSFEGAQVFMRNVERNARRYTKNAVQYPSGSLPALYFNHPNWIGKERPFLFADTYEIHRWLTRFKMRPTVGISWTGGVKETRRAARSLTLEDLLPIFKANKAVRFVSLQYDADPDDILAFAGFNDVSLFPPDYRAAFADLDQTASLISACDLVISVCNTTVHLAGALGKRCYVLAPHVPEWRYGLKETMSWYPCVKVIRQLVYGAWEPVIYDAAKIVAAL